VASPPETQAEASYEVSEGEGRGRVKNNFRPEFLNRIDATVVSRSLTVEEITKIVDMMLQRARPAPRTADAPEVTRAAKEHIISSATTWRTAPVRCAG
jgi:ATP-dependent Clp protease ATP-binding subunit ClpA